MTGFWSTSPECAGRLRLWSRLYPLLIVPLAAALLGACTQASHSPTVTPTATLAPTLASGQGSGQGSGDTSLPAPDSEQLARLSHVLSIVPESYSSVVYFDLKALASSPLLTKAIDVEAMGLQGAVPAAALILLDGLGVATDRGGDGLITVLEGPFDIDSLVQVASGFGLSIGGPKPKDYREHSVWSLEILSLSLAAGTIDKNTTVFASGSPTGGATAEELVKGALDSFDGHTPSLLDAPWLDRLVSNLPSGFATTIFQGCGDVSEIANVVDLPGCNGVGVSAGLQGEDAVVLCALVGFEDESLATAALQVAQQRLEAEGNMPFGEVVVGQQDSMIWTRVLVEAARVTEAVRGLIQHQR